MPNEQQINLAPMNQPQVPLAAGPNWVPVMHNRWYVSYIALKHDEKTPNDYLFCQGQIC